MPSVPKGAPVSPWAIARGTIQTRNLRRWPLPLPRRPTFPTAAATNSQDHTLSKNKIQPQEIPPEGTVWHQKRSETVDQGQRAGTIDSFVEEKVLKNRDSYIPMMSMGLRSAEVNPRASIHRVPEDGVLVHEGMNPNITIRLPSSTALSLTKDSTSFVREQISLLSRTKNLPKP